MESYISLGFNIALAVFIFFGVIFGLIRGLRKTASRGIFLVITSIVLLFVTIPICSALLKIKINTDITIEENTLIGNYSIEEIISFFIESMLGKDFASKNQELVNVITALPILLMNAIVYFVLFILCKYLLMPLNYIFYRLTFAPKKKKENLGFSPFDNDSENENLSSLSNDNSTNESNFPSNGNNSSNEEDIFADDVPPSNFQNENIETSSSPIESINEENKDNSIFTISTENNGDENLESQSNSIDAVEENLNTSEPMGTTEAQTFGKEGLFIKNEIETPKVEVEFKDNFDQPSKKDIKKAEKKRKKAEKIKVKKHRLWGALVGGFVGMFIMMNVCMPIYGVMNILKEANKLNATNLSDDEISLSKSTDGVTDEIISAYDNSIFYPVSKYLGLEGLSLAEFDYLTTKTVNNKKINLRGDISNLINTINKADSLVGKYKEYAPDNDFSKLSKNQVSELLDEAKSLLDFAKGVNLADCVGDYIIPVVCTIIINNDTKISDNEIVNALAINALKSLAETNNINVFDEAYNIIDLAKYLNDQGLLIRMFSGDFNDPIGIIKGLDSDFGEVFMGKLYKLQTVSITMPYLLNIGLNFLEQSINYGYVENDYSQDLESLKTSISNFVQETIDVIKTIDTSSNIYITNNTLVPLGKLLQTVKVSGIVSDQTYSKLIDYTVDFLQKNVVDIFPVDMRDYVSNELIENITKVDRWDEEMNKISSAITKLRDKESGIIGEVQEGQDLRTGTSIDIAMKQNVFDNIGEVLDILEGSVLFGAVSNKTIDSEEYKVSGTISLFISLLDYAGTTIEDTFNDGSVKKMTRVLEDMKDNLIKSRHTYDSENKFWQYNMSNIAPLIIEVYEMMDSNNFDVTISMGKCLDTAKHTTFFDSDTTLKFMDVALEIVQDGILGEDFEWNDGTDISKPQVLNDKIYELFKGVKDNLQLQATKERVRKDSKFWEEEFKYYRSLKNVAENSSSLNNISDAKGLSEDLDNINGSYTIPQQELFNIVAFAIKDIKTENPTDDVDIAINNVIDKISSRLMSVSYLEGKDLTNFWAIEFDHLSQVMDIEFNDSEDYKVKDNLDKIGKTLDNVIYGYSVSEDIATGGTESKTIRQSYLLLENDLREILASAMSSVKNSITSSFDGDIETYVNSALDRIKGNIEDTVNIRNVSFEKELTHMQTLANLKVNSSLMVYPSGANESEINLKLEENRQKLNILGRQLDSIAYAYQKEGNIYEYTDKINVNTSTNSQFITRKILNIFIADVFDIAKADEENLPANVNEYTSEDKEKIAFNTLIEDIQLEIGNVTNKDQIMSWQRELGFVNKLVKLNGGVNYTIDNVATNIGSNLDAIAFNVKSDDENTFDDIIYNAEYECEYIPQKSTIGDIYSGNSLFVTRSAIKTLMSSYLDRVKETVSADDDEVTKEQKTLVNDIIDNSINSVAENNTECANLSNYYPSFNKCFTDLTNIKNEIDEKSDAVSGGSKFLTESLAEEIDGLLHNFQLKPVMNILLTRRMASLIIHKIGVPNLTIGGVAVKTEATDYYSNLNNYYNDRNSANNNSDSEYYYTTQSVSESNYPNPFVTLYNKINDLI